MATDGQSDASWLQRIAHEMRGLYAPVIAQSIPDRRNKLHQLSIYDAAGLIIEAIEHGAFSGPDYITLRSRIANNRSQREIEPLRGSRAIVENVIDRLVDEVSDRPHSNDLAAMYQIIADAIEQEADRLDREVITLETPSLEDLSDDAPKKVFAEALNCYERDFNEGGRFAGLLHQISPRRFRARLDLLNVRDHARVMAAIGSWQRSRRKR